MAARRPPGIFEHASLLSEGSAYAGGQMWMLLHGLPPFKNGSVRYQGLLNSLLARGVQPWMQYPVRSLVWAQSARSTAMWVCKAAPCGWELAMCPWVCDCV